MPWASRWRTTNVGDTWQVRRQTYGYLPSRKASLPIGWYQIILLGDKGTCVLTIYPGLHSTTGQLGFEPATYWSQVQRPNHSATETHNGGNKNRYNRFNLAKLRAGWYLVWSPAETIDSRSRSVCSRRSVACVQTTPGLRSATKVKCHIN